MMKFVDSYFTYLKSLQKRAFNAEGFAFNEDVALELKLNIDSTKPIEISFEQTMWPERVAIDIPAAKALVKKIQALIDAYETIKK